MLKGLRGSTAFSTARLSLLASCRRPGLVVIHAAVQRNPRYSSIATAMLGRAVNSYQPPVQKGRITGQSLSSSPRANLDDLVKPHNLAQQSIGGFAGVQNRAMDGQRAFQMSLQKHKAKANPLLPISKTQPTMSSATVNSAPLNRKRNSSEISGIAATLNSYGSFQEESPTIDLTQEEPELPQLPAQVPSKQTVQVDFDPDDFDDDSDIDLDIEYPTGLPSSSARKPLHSISQNVSAMPPPAPAIPHTTTPNAMAQVSSAVPWSSSPPDHKRTPPGAALRHEPMNRQESKKSAVQEDVLDSSEPIRPAKRRVLPWSKEGTIQIDVICGKCGDEGYERNECTQKATKCTRCNIFGHHMSACHYQGRLPNMSAATPKARIEKSNEYFNTTASAEKAKTEAFRERSKALKKRKDAGLTSEEQQEVLKMTTKNARPAPVLLSDEQKKVLDIVCEQNQSVFFTGSAGTGKSVLMRAIISDLRKKYKREPDRVAVTASTGLAACNIGGVTLHSFSGIGLGKESVADLVKKIRKNQKAKARWLRTKILVIDEISMVDGDLFDKLEEIGREIRKNGRPFGGIQLVITGDFFQLPPVPDYGKQAKFAFDATTWPTSINHTIGLTEVFRQRDPEFAQMLNEMRLGKISDKTISMFKDLDREVHGNVTQATELFPTRNEVDNANSFKMRHLAGKSYYFQANDSGTMQDIRQRDKLLANCMAPPVLELRKGAQVMLIKNMDDSLVNGSLGTVVAFMSEKDFSIYDQVSELPPTDEGYDEEQSQNMAGLNKFKSKINAPLIGDTAKRYPLVRFEVADGTTRDLLCQPEEWKIELPNGEVQAQRSQLPLILAWALSIHKAQGQTLERVTVDLRKIFENGQAYVALSRATTKEGLQVKNFNKKAIMAHPKVARFYDGLYNVNKALRNPTVQHAVPPRKAVPRLGMDPSESSFIMDHSNNYDEEELLAAAAYH